MGFLHLVQQSSKNGTLPKSKFYKLHIWPEMGCQIRYPPGPALNHQYSKMTGIVSFDGQNCEAVTNKTCDRQYNVMSAREDRRHSWKNVV